MIRKEVQKVLKHPVNHVLIQHYRGGSDNISEHSDKTLDIAMGSKIVNVSVGARRTMLMHMKKDPSLEVQRCEDDSKNENWEEQILRRDMQRIPMPHNSMFVLGPETNKKWLHGIRQDKRSASIKSPEELAYNSERISLTFRHIATYLSKDEKLIYGQGATAKVKEDARPVINGDDASNQKILFAFAAENRQTDFNWQAEYGQGFDVLHFKLPTPKLLISDALDAETARIRICLYEMGLDFTEQLVGETEAVSFRSLGLRGKTPIFVDKDRERTAIEGSLVVLQYLDLIYNSLNLFPSQAESVSQFTRALSRLQESEKLIGLCEKLDATREDIERELDVWESYLQKSQYVSGDEFFLVDIAVFPALKSVYARLPGDDEKKTKFPAIRLYVDELEKRESIIKAYSTISEPLAVEEGTNDNVDALVDGLKKVTIKQD
jgi:glutathione S-transferase